MTLKDQIEERLDSILEAYPLTQHWTEEPDGEVNTEPGGGYWRDLTQHHIVLKPEQLAAHGVTAPQPVRIFVDRDGDFVMDVELAA